MSIELTDEQRYLSLRGRYYLKLASLEKTAPAYPVDIATRTVINGIFGAATGYLISSNEIGAGAGALVSAISTLYFDLGNKAFNPSTPILEGLALGVGGLALGQPEIAAGAGILHGAFRESRSMTYEQRKSKIEAEFEKNAAEIGYEPPKPAPRKPRIRYVKH